MRHQAIPVPSGRLCVEWVVPERAAVLRVFRLRPFLRSLAPIDPATGQPRQRWDWACFLEVVTPATLRVHGALTGPTWSEFCEFRCAAASLGMVRLEWAKWRGDRVLLQCCTLSPRSWPVLTYPLGRTS